MAESLFVYGTLAPGGPNAHVLGDVPGTWEPAMVRGVLHQKGWGAAQGFPGIVLDECASEVPGFLFTSEELPAHWSRLDEFEGAGYHRALVSAQLESGRTVQAHIYVLASKP